VSPTHLDVVGELGLVLVAVVLLELAHVVGDVLTEDAVAVNACVVVDLLVVTLALGGVTREAPGDVRDVETTVDGALYVIQSTEIHSYAYMPLTEPRHFWNTPPKIARKLAR